MLLWRRCWGCNRDTRTLAATLSLQPKPTEIAVSLWKPNRRGNSRTVTTLDTAWLTEPSLDFQYMVCHSLKSPKSSMLKTPMDPLLHLVISFQFRMTWATCCHGLLSGMLFNIEKCNVMHFWRKNTLFNYQLEGKYLETVSEEKDLGIIVSNDSICLSGCMCANDRNLLRQSLPLRRQLVKQRNSTLHRYWR